MTRPAAGTSGACRSGTSSRPPSCCSSREGSGSPAGLPLAAVLGQELADYQVRISQAGHDSYSAPSGQHDDLLMALSLVAWFGGDVGETEFW